MSAAFTTRAGFLTSSFYAIIFLGLGAQLPFWPIWLSDWGLTEAEIGWMLGLSILARVAGSTLLPAIADRYAIRRLMLAVAGAGTGVIFLAHLGVATKPGLLVLTLAAAFVSAPLIPLGEALGLRAAGWGPFPYAHARAVGSVAFLAVVLATGALLDRFGSNVILYAVTLCAFGAALLGPLHPGGGAPPELGAEGAATPDKAGRREAYQLLRNPVFLTFAISIALGHAAHAVFYAYSALHWREAGLSQGIIGALWATGVLAEILLMLGPGRRWVAHLGPARAMAIAALASVLRWGLMMQEPTGAILWFCQALHALTFALALLGSMAFLAAALPPRLAGTAQGLANGLLGGLSVALVTLVAGGLAETVPPSMLYAIALVPTAIAGLAAWHLGRIWQGGRIVE